MNIDSELKIRDHKCYGEELQGFDQILPLNILIGKNNSGKSTLFEIIQCFCQGNTKSLQSGAKVYCVNTLTKQKLDEQFKTQNRGFKGYANDLKFAQKELLNTKSYFKLQDSRKLGLEYLSAKIDEDYNLNRAKSMIEKIRFSYPFNGKEFVKITAERDIVPELTDDNNIKFSDNGSGITNTIRSILLHSKFDRKIVTETLLSQINKITSPEIIFSAIWVKKHDSNFNEIYFSNENDEDIPLSAMGSGIKTIIILLVELLVRPRIEQYEPKTKVFAFEEIENNLHPALQRRLFSFIRDYIIENNTFLFLSTHSNVPIDLFGPDKSAQILHVIQENGISKVRTVLTDEHTVDILNDLEYLPSSILQSNGIIWVEGPSDRIYINKWISLNSPELKEGLHYSIMFYGGRNLANVTASRYDELNELVNLLRINRNAYVVIDKDSKRATKKLNETKRRIQLELGGKNCWVTQGIEIENYLSERTVKMWLQSKGRESHFSQNKHVKFEKAVTKSISVGSTLNYANSKRAFSQEIVSFMNLLDLHTFDLKDRIESLVGAIKSWNFI